MDDIHFNLREIDQFRAQIQRCKNKIEDIDREFSLSVKRIEGTWTDQQFTNALNMIKIINPKIKLTLDVMIKGLEPALRKALEFADKWNRI